MLVRVTLCAVLLLLVGCAGEPASPHAVQLTASTTAREPFATALPPEDLSRRWLDKAPCPAPCWEGITPGFTTIQEATRILGGPPLHFEVQRRERHPYLSFLTWEGSDHSWGEIDFDRQGMALVASRISVNVYEPSTIGDVMTAYGEPGFVAVYAAPHEENLDRFIYGLTYLYPEDGLEFHVSGTVAPLKPEGKSNHIRFFEPLLEDFASSPERFESIASLPDLVPWDGFKPFREYCVEVYPTDYDWRCPPED